MRTLNHSVRTRGFLAASPLVVAAFGCQSELFSGCKKKPLVHRVRLMSLNCVQGPFDGCVLAVKEKAGLHTARNDARLPEFQFSHTKENKTLVQAFARTGKKIIVFVNKKLQKLCTAESSKYSTGNLVFYIDFCNFISIINR